MNYPQPGWGPGYQPPPPRSDTRSAGIVVAAFAGVCIYSSLAASSIAATIALSILAFGLAGVALAARLGRIRVPVAEVKLWVVVVPTLAGVFSLLMGLSAANSRRIADEQSAEEARLASIRAATTRNEAEFAAARLRERVPTVVRDARARLALAQSQFAQFRLESAAAALTEARAALAPVVSLSPVPAEVQATQASFDALEAQMRPYLAFSTKLSVLSSALSAGEGTDVVEFDSRLERSIAEIDAADANVRSRFGASPALLVNQANATRRSIRRRVATEIAARAAQVALIQRCGPAPQLGPWDGEIIGSEAFLQRGAHDPDSIDVENCTPPRVTNRCWVSTCVVRGRNAFGALVANSYEFTVMHNLVIDARRR